MINVKAIVPGIYARAASAGLSLTREQAETLAENWLKLTNWEERSADLDASLSKISYKYQLHMLLTKRPDYQVTVNG